MAGSDLIFAPEIGNRSHYFVIMRPFTQPSTNESFDNLRPLITENAAVNFFFFDYYYRKCPLLCDCFISALCVKSIGCDKWVDTNELVVYPIKNQSLYFHHGFFRCCPRHHLNIYMKNAHWNHVSCVVNQLCQENNYFN